MKSTSFVNYIILHHILDDKLHILKYNLKSDHQYNTV